MSKNRPVEPNGTVFTVSSQNKYVIEDLLGAGGFGNVYKVFLQRDPTMKYAMKTERVGIPAMCERLKIECVIFEQLRTIAGNRKHFIRMVDVGITDRNKFLVMEMVWFSLDAIYNRMCKRQFSLRTTIEVALQTLKAVEALHELGWLHRDVKPGNFSIGRPPNDDIIYMLDFGTARQFRDFQGRLRIPRVSVTTPKTLTFCSIRAHENTEQGRRDDLECWMYMILDFLHPMNCAWRWAQSLEEIYGTKLHLLANIRKLYQEKYLIVPIQFLTTMERIASMDHVDPGDFKAIRNDFDVIVRDEKVSLGQRMDWIGKQMPEKPKPVQEPPKVETKTKEQEIAAKKAAKRAAKDAKIGARLTKGYKMDGIVATPEQFEMDVILWKKFEEERKRMQEDSSSEESSSDSTKSSEDSRKGSKQSRHSKRSRRDARKKSKRSEISRHSKRSRRDAKKKSRFEKSRGSRIVSAKDEAKIPSKIEDMRKPTEQKCEKKEVVKSGESEQKMSKPEEVTCRSATDKSMKDDSKIEYTCKSTTSKRATETEKTAKSGIFNSFISKLKSIRSKKPEQPEKKDPGAV